MGTLSTVPIRLGRRTRIALAAGGVAVALAPGWRGTLVEIPHEVVLGRARRAPAGSVFGVTRPVVREGAATGEEWHASYVDRALAGFLAGVGLRGVLTKLSPPDHVAHVPAGARRADGYFDVEAAAHWPWWRPGGGLDWRLPD